MYTSTSLLNTVPDAICLSQFSHLCKMRANLNEFSFVCFAMAAIPCIETNILAVPARGVPLTQMP